MDGIFHSKLPVYNSVAFTRPTTTNPNTIKRDRTIIYEAILRAI